MPRSRGAQERKSLLKSRLALTAASVLALLLGTTGAALATGPGKQHSPDTDRSAATVQYGHDEGSKRPGGNTEGAETLVTPGAAGGGPGAGSAVKVGGATTTGTAPGAPASGTSPSAPVLTPGAGAPSILAVPGPLGTAPGAPTAGAPGAPTSGAPGAPPSIDRPPTPDAGGPSVPAGAVPGEAGVLGEVASGGPDTAKQAPAGGDVRAGDQVSAGGKPGLAFTGFSAIPVLLAGLAMLAGGLLLRRSRSTA